MILFFVLIRSLFLSHKSFECMAGLLSLVPTLGDSQPHSYCFIPITYIIYQNVLCAWEGKYLFRHIKLNCVASSLVNNEQNA